MTSNGISAREASPESGRRLFTIRQKVPLNQLCCEVPSNSFTDRIHGERIDSPMAQVVQERAASSLFCVAVAFQRIQLANHRRRDDERVAVALETSLKSWVSLCRPAKSNRTLVPGVFLWGNATIDSHHASPEMFALLAVSEFAIACPYRQAAAFGFFRVIQRLLPWDRGVRFFMAVSFLCIVLRQVSASAEDFNR